ncbi:MAG: hypothetical protein ACK481_01740 [Candidatus Melainabacteria bacterium]|jgi:hypothetical protein
MVNPGGVNPPHFSITNRLRVALQRDKMPTLQSASMDSIRDGQFKGVLLSETRNPAILQKVVSVGLNSAMVTNQIVNSYPNAESLYNETYDALSNLYSDIQKVLLDPVQALVTETLNQSVEKRNERLNELYDQIFSGKDIIEFLWPPENKPES